VTKLITNIVTRLQTHATINNTPPAIAMSFHRAISYHFTGR